MSATPAAVDRNKLDPPASANNLDEAVRMTLGVLDAHSLLANFQNVSALSVEIWHRLARAGFGRKQGSTTDTIAAELRKLVEKGALRFGGNVTALPKRRPRASEILAAAARTS
jgi:hypothetical protein